MTTRSLIVGSSGQDGRLLYEQLQAAGHTVLGLTRDEVRTTEPTAPAWADLASAPQVAALVTAWLPDRIYYLAAHHHSSQDSTGDPLSLYSASHTTHALGLLHFLEAIRLHAPAARLFYASSCLVFGTPTESPQSEATPIAPRCIYGITKAAGMQACRFYRDTHGVFASSGILYNHESPLRAERFVSRKITSAARRIAAGSGERLILGDLTARIDWGYAPDFVAAMEKILAIDTPDDFVIATGEAHAVQEMAEIAFRHASLDWQAHVDENPAVLRRRNAPLIGDAARLRERTGWRPSVGFEEMVRRLVEAK